MHDLGGANIRVDRRGCWLLVDDGVAGVHVNGRPVRRKALLRAGDCLHVGGSAILLAGSAAVAPAEPPPGGAEPGDARWLLRAVGGRHHGRGFTLERARTIGSDADADIRLDPPVAGRHARIVRERGRVVLRALAGGDHLVNGEQVRDAELRAGDQLLVGSRDRFVLEAPCDAPPPFEAGEERTLGDREGKGASPAPLRLPWLLLAALLIAAVLSALLLL